MNGAVLLPIAAVCQLLIAAFTLGAFVELIHRHLHQPTSDPTDRPLTATGLPAATAAMLNLGLFLLSGPSLFRGEAGNGVLTLVGLSFGFIAIASSATMIALKVPSRALVAQASIGFVGLGCLFVPLLGSG